MIIINDLKDIIEKEVRRLFLVIWPPFAENDASQIDISAGYVFEDEPDQMFIITTDKNDLVSPYIYYQNLPNHYFSWEELLPRMKSWMDCVENMELDTEYYEVTHVDLFKDIIHQKIIDVELVKVSGHGPIGIKLIFENDYILSTPITDGNTIETRFFNQNCNLNNFFTLGKIKYKSIKEYPRYYGDERLGKE